jgi:hypothetical protein
MSQNGRRVCHELIQQKNLNETSQQCVINSVGQLKDIAMSTVDSARHRAIGTCVCYIGAFLRHEQLFHSSCMVGPVSGTSVGN